MVEKNYSNVVNIARDYYNSADADNFYFLVWGGEDIHIGLYNNPDESIEDASRRTVEIMANMLPGLGNGSRVLDIGSGYGGSARYLAATFGCHVTALNLSEVENNRNRSMNREKGLDHLIDVVDGNFEEIPLPDNSFDAVWSQDAILHSGNREKVMEEVYRLLKKGGKFIFTDIMQADDCPDGVLQPILDRIHLSSLGSLQFYREKAEDLGMEFLDFGDWTPMLATHYQRVLDETEKKEPELEGIVSGEYIKRMKKGLQHWVDGGNNGYLTWGIMHLKK
jgi:sarcosine/dimethylglycine N-methyltransferase